MPVMFPVEPDVFWQQLKRMVQEAIGEYMKAQPLVKPAENASQQPLLKLAELRSIFRVSKPTLYKWIKEGRLRSFKIRNRRYFTREDVEALMQGKSFPASPFFPSQSISESEVVSIVKS
ncbi:MAG: helix-turn-helix domain-containing protein [Williamsia sp.]|nr:helix-turn-helix domain-containing protein [Williamsia sp.]